MLAIAERRRPRPADCFSFGTSRYFLSSVGAGAFRVPNARSWAGVLSKGSPVHPLCGRAFGWSKILWAVMAFASGPEFNS